MRPFLYLLLAAFLCVLAPPDIGEGAQDRRRPIVRLIATGGTIANHPDGRLTASELVELIPSINRHVEVETEQFANLPSSSVTVEQWLALAQRLNELFRERQDLTGVVVTSGTDTLEETAYFLNLTVKTNRPIVVVGAMRMPNSPGYDGASNLLDSFRVASSPASIDRGVLVVMNNQIHSARDVTKSHAQLLDAFKSSPRGILGTVNTDRVIYHRRPNKLHTHRSEFDSEGIGSLPIVDVVMSYLGASGDLILSARQNGIEGLVVAGTGAGSTTPDQRNAIKQLISEGVPVVITTRTGSGRVPARRRQRNSTRAQSERLYDLNRIAGEDLSPVKARVLLMLALTQTTEPTEIQRMFTSY